MHLPMSSLSICFGSDFPSLSSNCTEKHGCLLFREYCYQSSSNLNKMKTSSLHVSASDVSRGLEWQGTSARFQINLWRMEAKCLPSAVPWEKRNRFDLILRKIPLRISELSWVQGCVSSCELSRESDIFPHTNISTVTHLMEMVEKHMWLLLRSSPLWGHECSGDDYYENIGFALYVFLLYYRPAIRDIILSIPRELLTFKMAEPSIICWHQLIS